MRWQYCGIRLVKKTERIKFINYLKKRKMDKETIIRKLIEEGYTTDFTLDKDCLYCEETDTNYMLKSFSIDRKWALARTV